MKSLDHTPKSDSLSGSPKESGESVQGTKAPMSPRRRRFNQIAAIVLVAVLGLDIVSSLSAGRIGPVLFDVVVIGIIVWYYRKNLVSRAPDDDIFPDQVDAASHLAESALKSQSQGSTLKSVVVGLIPVLIVARVVGMAIGDWVRTPEAPLSSQEFLADDSIKEYVASDFGFKVNFPGFPIREVSTLDLEGYDVPYTTYTRELRGGDVVYMAAVSDYSALPVATEDLSLEGALNGIAQNTPEGRLASTTPAALGGLQALEGEISTVIDGTPYVGYARAAKRDLKIYLVFTIGSDRDDYSAFARSFTFTQ